jgi:predicted deacylase
MSETRAVGVPTFEVLPRDLSAYRQGNVGIDYVHRFESGRPGPHVLINALTHGNELCGMVAATHLLDQGAAARHADDVVRQRGGLRELRHRAPV